MATISLSLFDLFQTTFGYQTKALDPKLEKVIGENNPNRREYGAGGAPYYQNLHAGKEYFMPVIIKYPDRNSMQDSLPGNSSQNFSKEKEFELPYPIISIESRKTIIETHLTERRGTVKELINTQDYLITIKGFIISQTHDYPEEGVTELRALYEHNTPLSIQCALTDIFLLRPDRSGSDLVVISELNLPMLRGVKNICPYELKLISDEPFNLISVK